MSKKHSIASKNRWKFIKPLERKNRMSAVAKAKWAKMDPADRKAHSQMMLKARLKNKE